MQLAAGRLSLLAWIVIVTLSGGCSLMQSRSDALTNYEQTRQELSGAPVQPVSYLDEEDDGLSLEDFSPENVGDTVRRATGNGPNPTEAKQLFQQAQQIYHDAVRLREQNQTAASQARFVESGEAFATTGFAATRFGGEDTAGLAIWLESRSRLRLRQPAQMGTTSSPSKRNAASSRSPSDRRPLCLAQEDDGSSDGGK